MNFLCSGRSLWAVDKSVIKKCGSVCLYLCAFFLFNDDEPIQNTFCTIMNTLMLGCGTSFDTYINTRFKRGMGL